MLITQQLLDNLTAQAKASPRLRMNFDLAPGPASPCVALNIPIGQWHTVEVLESGTVILEVKDGPYAPLGEGEIM